MQILRPFFLAERVGLRVVKAGGALGQCSWVRRALNAERASRAHQAL